MNRRSNSGQDLPLDDDRSAAAKGFDLSGRIIAAGVGLGLLSWGGLWVDQKLGLNGPFLALGAILGVFCFVWQLIQLVQVLNRRQKKKK